MGLIVKPISSLEKCFLDEDINLKTEYNKASCLKNELFRFGICYCMDERCHTGVPIILGVESDIKERISVRRVEHVPVKLAAHGWNEDPNYLRKKAGLYPDPLIPLNSHNRIQASQNLESLYVEVDTNGIETAGLKNIKFTFTNAYNNTVMAETEFQLEIIDCKLPKQDLIYTQWFYCDCLMDYYRTNAFDQKHWEIIENYLKTAVKNGINMILTPIFTPPLDTFVGGERTTTQLVDIEIKNEKYSFDFSKLGQWIDLCLKTGIEYFEMAHLFTQWGAEHAPKIVANVDGEIQKIFGWETDACGEDYIGFLKIFIPELLEFLVSRGVADRCMFHLSDEPELEQLPSYKAVRDAVAPLLDGYPIMDALSNYEFYSEGAVGCPVPSTGSVEKFIENNVPDLWTYYCGASGDKISNRFLSMPSYRNRILGIQLYKFNIKGFLHWGYNYFNDRFSYSLINPFLVTDGDYFAPAGDTFSVYPAPDGTAFESLRVLVFHDGIQDISALKLCEKLCGRDYVMNLLEGECEPITFKEYPQNAEYLLYLREKINQSIKSVLKE